MVYLKKRLKNEYISCVNVMQNNCLNIRFKYTPTQISKQINCFDNKYIISKTKVYIYNIFIKIIKSDGKERLVMSFWLKVCIYSHTRGVKLGLGLGFMQTSQVLPH